VLAAPDSGEERFDLFDPTAAVLAGSGDGAGGSNFIRLLIIHLLMMRVYSLSYLRRS